jgi:hypothetical protein
MAMLSGAGNGADRMESTRVAGIAGVLAAVALAGEFLFFSLSGFQQTTFNDPASAMAFLAGPGALVRVAVLFGAAGVALTLIFLAGLATRLRARAPALGLATLYFGVVGNVGDGLVALSFWIGIPMFVGLAAHQASAAESAWPAFTAITGGFQGFGNLFLGLSLLAAGLAAVSTRALSRWLGGIAIAAGLLAVAGVLVPSAQMGFLLAMVLVVVFRIWAGVALYRGERLRSAGGLAGATASESRSAA